MRRTQAVAHAVLPPELMPPMVRLRGPDRPTKVIKDDWRDPDDNNRATKSVQHVHGFRAYCPLRRILKASHGAVVTAQHVLAADHLRGLYDIARLGFSAVQIGWAPALRGPRLGLGQGQIAQVQAAREVQRALGRFTQTQQAMLDAIVLHNHSLQAWARMRGIAAGRAVDLEQGKLIAVLDLLVEHFQSEVDMLVRRDQVLVPD